MRRDPHHLTDRLSPVLPVHKLADAVDQDVLVEDGREALARRVDLDDRLIVLVTQRAHVRMRRQRENGMPHGGHVRARRHVHSIKLDTIDKEITHGMAFGKQGTHVQSVDCLAAPSQMIRSIGD